MAPARPPADAASELFQGASAVLAEGLHPAWRELLSRPALAPHLHRGLESCGALRGDAGPYAAHLDPFRWAPPGAVRVIVLGPDGPDGGADEHRRALARLGPQGGLWLSALSGPDAGNDPRPWDRWKPFVAALLRVLTEGPAPPPTLLLGERAHGHARDVSGGEVLRAPPSVGAAEPSVRRALPRVEWGPRGETWGFCDGAASGNGRPGAEGGFGVYVLTGPLWGLELRGRVAPALYALRDPSRPLLGFAPQPGPPVPPTNNRAEYLGGAWLLLLLLRGGGGGARLISDSRLLVETVENWLPARRKAGTAARLKNLDLLAILETLLAALRARAPAAFSHVRAHRPRPAGPFRRAADLRALLEWQGNRRADALATAAVAPPGTPFGGAEVALGGALADARHWGLVGRWAAAEPPAAGGG